MLWNAKFGKGSGRRPQSGQQRSLMGTRRHTRFQKLKICSTIAVTGAGHRGAMAVIAETGRMGVGAAGADPTAGGRPRPLLVGRDQELERLFGMIDQIAAGGGALVIRGEAGIGKSALLAAVQQRARERGTTVVTTTGTPSEGRMAFGGLHQLLIPFLDRVDHRPDPQRKALDVAFGVTEGDTPDLFLVGLASLGVVTDR